ncbi:mechanosensitive ion channel [bacterium]|nr:mechanosensitive ion channel [bacterium]
MRFLVLLSSLLWSIAAFSQVEKVDLSTPRKTVYNHLWYLQKEQYKPGLAAKSLANKKIEMANPERLAIQLKQIFDGKGYFIQLEKIPDEAGFIDSVSGEHKVVVTPELPDIYVVKQGNDWVYSAVSIEAIPRLHKEVYPGGLDRLINAVPASWKTEFLGLEVGQYIGILLILAAALLFHRVLTFLFRRLILGVLRRFNKSYVSSGRLKTVARPLSWYLLIKFIAQLVPALLLPIAISKYVQMVLHAAAPFFGTLMFYNLVGLLSDFFKSRAEKTDGTLDDQLVPLVSKVMRAIVLLVGVAYVLFGLGFDIRPYLVGVSFGGIALALAAQDTVKNLFGSAMIFLDRPFQIGDWINYNGMDGTVEEVGFRSTRMRTFYNSVITIPNGKLADSSVDNYGLRVYRRYSTKITITYDTPPELVQVFVEGLREIVKNHPDTRKDYFEVHLNDLGATSLEILFYIFFTAKDWSGELRGRHDVVMAILQLAKKLGVRFAFPTQTIHIEELPGQLSTTPQYRQSKGQFEDEMRNFIDDWKKNINKQG